MSELEFKVARILREGPMPAIKACRKCGLNVSIWTAIRWIQSGKLEGYKVGGRWHCSLQAVHRMVANGSNSTTSRSGSATQKATITKAAAGRYLESLGLGRNQQQASSRRGQRKGGSK